MLQQIKKNTELLNHYFPQYSQEVPLFFYQYTIEQEPPQTQTLSEIMIHASDLYGALTSLNLHKAMGADGIGPNILSRCALALYGPLIHLFSLTISQESLLKDWLTHCIIPIHKKGDRSLINNHRPISLLSAASEVLERLTYDCLFVQITVLRSVWVPLQTFHSLATTDYAGFNC